MRHDFLCLICNHTEEHRDRWKTVLGVKVNSKRPTGRVASQSAPGVVLQNRH
jgi:hypothetical protein